MRDETIPQTVLFPDLFNKPLVATFDQSHASSDGGAVLLKAAEARYGLIDGFARCLVEAFREGPDRLFAISRRRIPAAVDNETTVAPFAGER